MMSMRGGGLLGLASRLAGTKAFSTEIFVSIRLVRDDQTGRPKGFGFVKYSSQAAAEKAVKAMDGRIIRGRLIFVETAKERDTAR